MYIPTKCKPFGGKIMQQLLLASIQLNSSGKVLVNFVEKQRHTDEDVRYGASLGGPNTLKHNVLTNGGV